MSLEITQELSAQQQIAKTNARLDEHEREALLALLEGRWSQFAVELNNWEQVNHKLPIPRKMELQRALSEHAGRELSVIVAGKGVEELEKLQSRRIDAKILFK